MHQALAAHLFTLKNSKTEEEEKETCTLEVLGLFIRCSPYGMEGGRAEEGQVEKGCILIEMPRAGLSQVDLSLLELYRKMLLC